MKNPIPAGRALDAAAILAAVRSVMPRSQGTIHLHEPTFAGKEWEYVKDCIDTGWVSTGGKYVDRFERQLEEITGAKRAVAVVNGTAALHACLLLVDVEPGDEVLVPTLTFIATANAVSYCGATPHLVDSTEETLGLDPAKLDAYLREIADVRGDACFNRKTGKRIRAVMPMHTFGHPVDIDAVVELSDRYRIALVEDAAESIGSYYKGRHTGNWGRIAGLSFNGNKTVTTGGGGALLTNDEALGKLAKHITTTARLPHRWSFLHDRVGYNYRMPNINAALGCAQLEQLTGFIERKRALAASYGRAFKHVHGVRFFTEPSFARSNYWLNAILLDRPFAHQRDELLDTLNGRDIGARPVWTLMHQLEIYAQCPRMPSLDVAEDIERRLVNIPSSPFLAPSHA